MSKKAREEIKKLQSMRDGYQAELEILKTKEQGIKQEIISKKSSINTINQRIANLSKNNEEIIVSEHAILRYIERVVGIDVDKIVEQILPEETKIYIENLGNGNYPINDGEFRIVVKDRVVVTVLSDDEE